MTARKPIHARTGALRKTKVRRTRPHPLHPGRTGLVAKAGVDQWEELQNYIQIQDKITRGLRLFIDEMTVVFRFIESVSECHAVDRILELLLDVMKELFRFEAAAVYMETWSDDGKSLGVVLQHAQTMELVETFQKQLQVDAAIYEWVYKQGHAIVMPAVHRPQGKKNEERWSFMIVPLATSTERVGRLELVFDRSEGEFTQQTFSILDVLLKHAALILVNERIYEKERKTVQTYIQLDNLKRDIVNITTHEIKTPLTIINANALMLRRNGRIEREEVEKMMDSITRQCQRIDTIINQLVDTAQLEDGRVALDLEPITLEELTQEILQDIFYDREKISFESAFPEQTWPALVDRDSMYKVLRNLMENAVKYSPHGGAIQIRTHYDQAHVFWEIQDHGVGIPEEEQAKIFDKFYRIGTSTTRGVRGMGFGLYLVKKNLELNHGEIQVVSKTGDGALFKVVLPKASLTKEKHPTPLK